MDVGITINHKLVYDKEVVVLSCNKCLKDYLKIGSNEDIDELNDCIDKYLD